MDHFEFIVEDGAEIDRRRIEDDGWGDVVFVIADLEPCRKKPTGEQLSEWEPASCPPERSEGGNRPDPEDEEVSGKFFSANAASLRLEQRRALPGAASAPRTRLT